MSGIPLTITVPEDAHVGNEDGTVGIVTAGHKGDMQGALRYILAAHGGEPLFVIRGRDALAVPVLASYVEECGRHGLIGYCYHPGTGQWVPGQSSRADTHRARFAAWQRDNTKLTRLPDPLPAPPAEQDSPS